jgi:hypothetical protein
MRHSTAIKRRRFLISVPAFIVGAGVDLLIRWLVSGSFMFVEAVACGLAVAAVALVFAEKKHGLPTVDDLHAARRDEEMGVLGLADSVPRGRPDLRR